MKDDLKLLIIAHAALSMVDDKAFGSMEENWLLSAKAGIKMTIQIAQAVDASKPHAAAARAGAKAGAKKAKKRKKKVK